MSDILSQPGGRGPRLWQRLAAVAAVLVLAGVLIVEHLPHHPPAKARSSPAAVTVVPLPAAAGPAGVSGAAMSPADSLRLLTSGQRPTWLWPATGRVQPVGGLPPDGPGYQFIRVAGGWAVQAGSAARLRCGSCAGSRLPVYFLPDQAQSVTLAGTADGVAPGAAAGSLWLTSYPQGADMSTEAGTAQEISTAGAPAGPRLRLPAGYAIFQGTDVGLLLAPAAPSGTAPDELWNPSAPHAASRTFAGVLAASAVAIAWATPCDPLCRVEVLDLATGRPTVVRLPAGSSAVNAAFSPDGKYLALQVSSTNVGDDGALAMALDVVSLGGASPAVAQAFRVSSDALVGFGWPDSGDDLVAELNFIAKIQIASWQPGAHRLAVAAMSPGAESASIVTG